MGKCKCGGGKKKGIVGLAVLMLLMSGCGHNVVVYGDGFGAKVGFIPEQYALGIQLVHGKMLTACVRENTKVSLASDIGADATKDDGKGIVNNGTKFEMEVGDQVTGYTVDLEEVKARK